MIDVPSVVTAASVFAGALFEHERSDKSAFRPFSLDVSAFIAYPNKLRALFGFNLGLNENGFFSVKRKHLWVSEAERLVA